MSDEPSYTLIPGMLDISTVNCSAPLIPWIPFNESMDGDRMEWYSQSRLCFSGCCFPCKNYMNVSEMTNNLELTVIALESIVFVLSFLTLVNYFVSPKLLVNGFAGIQAFAFMVLSTSLSIGQINIGESDRCYDAITPMNGHGSSRCMAQGVLYVLGSHLMNLALTFRIFSVLTRIVWGKVVQKRYIMVITCVISALFAGISSKHVSYQGGIFCSPDPPREISLVKIPGLVYSISGLLILIGLSGYVSNTLYHISLNVTKSRMSDETDGDVRLGIKVRLALMAYLRSVRLLWRTYICASFLTTLVVCGLLFIFPKSGKYHPPHEMPVSVWLHCVYRNMDAKICIEEQIKKGDIFYREKIISIIVICVQLIFFIITESRFILFKAWYQIIMNPGLLVRRKELNKMIDEFITPDTEDLNKTGCSFSEPDNGQPNWFSRYKETREFRDFEQQLANHRRTMNQSFDRYSNKDTSTVYHNSNSTSATKTLFTTRHRLSDPNPFSAMTTINDNDANENIQSNNNNANDNTDDPDDSSLDIIQFLQTT